MRRLFYRLAGLCFFLGFARCAQVAPLTGGERDREPPVLVEALPSNGTRRFSGSEIVLKFNEYVQLKDLNNQLMVSPRLKTPPEVSAEGREVRVKLKAVELQPNTTYRIAFGKAIADMTESNSLAGLSYVFSTGDFTDSLRMRGSVVTASNNALAADVLVGLYTIQDSLTESEKDSLPFIVPPDYSVKTDQAGKFSITHLPARTYIVYAVSDLNRNGLYDGASERIAFLNEPVKVTGDTSVAMRLFAEETQRLFVKRAFSASPGSAMIILNREVYVRVKTLDPGQRGHVIEKFPGARKDTIELLYRQVEDTLSFVLDCEEPLFSDTVRVKLPKQKGKKRLPQMKMEGADRLRPASPVRLSFPVWMDTTFLNAGRMSVHSRDDSLIGSRPWKLRWTDVSTLELSGEFREGTVYRVSCDTAVARSAEGTPSDSAAFVLRFPGAADRSRLLLNIVVEKKQPYVVQLIDGRERAVAQRSFAVALSSANRIPLVFDDLVPGTYRVKLIFDDNANQRWDTGDLLRGIQPERVIIGSKELKILADWEVEEEMIMRE